MGVQDRADKLDEKQKRQQAKRVKFFFLSCFNQPVECQVHEIFVANRFGKLYFGNSAIIAEINSDITPEIFRIWVKKNVYSRSSRTESRSV